VVFTKYTERACEARVDFWKIEGFFCKKKTMVRPICAVSAPDRTAAESGWRDHVGRPAFGGKIHMEKIRQIHVPLKKELNAWQAPELVQLCYLGPLNFWKYISDP
jgi:hypothetical protein